MHELISRKLFDDQVANLTHRLAGSRNWVLHRTEYPIIDCEFRDNGRTPIRLRFQCNDWDELPPAVELLAADGSFLTALPGQLPNQFNRSNHPKTHRPFICMRGTREYHTHPSHINDSWEAIKNGDAYTLGGILTQIWHAWLKGGG